VRAVAPSLSCSLALLLLAGCAAQPVAVPPNPAFDFSKVRRISVIPFDGPGGAEATDEFVRQLVQTGIEVTDAKHPGDVVLKGAVTEYKPNVQFMVTLGSNYEIVTVASQLSAEANAVAAHKTQVASIIAEAGLQAHLDDAATHRLVWGDSYSYEGAGLSTTLGAVVSALMRSIKRTFPQMKTLQSS